MSAPNIISYLYTGTNQDGACVLGVLAAINADGTAELWSREPNLGTVVHIVKADTLEIACPIHPLPRPETKEEYDGIMLAALHAFFDKVKTQPACGDDIREIARLANYMADLWEFVDYGDEANASTTAADCSASPREA